MERIPKIARVEPIGQTELLVRFDNGVEKIYDCRSLLVRPQFHLLANTAFFRAVRVDPGGYGISWSDEIDLSEYELWVRGTPPAKKEAQPQGRAG
ncbi:MAG: DUF2442 domain-containing protein [Thermoguttaceae bacterium]|jgi:hypothetical protein